MPRRLATESRSPDYVWLPLFWAHRCCFLRCVLLRDHVYAAPFSSVRHQRVPDGLRSRRLRVVIQAGDESEALLTRPAPSRCTDVNKQAVRRHLPEGRFKWSQYTNSHFVLDFAHGCLICSLCIINIATLSGEERDVIHASENRWDVQI